MVTRIAASTAILSIAAVSVAQAQGVASDRLIDSITVSAERQHDLDVPAPTASKTAVELRAQNLVNPEDALKYVPNLTIRKRYIGDRNALIGGRSFSTLQAPRGLVLMDGYLLSNFLGRFDAPRWNMIAPEEIERVDVLYGPFSAIYPGNSIGTTVAVRTRRPQQQQLSVRTTAFGERFEEYGRREDFSGYQASGFFGDRFDNGAWLTLAANRQDSTSHPMQYFTTSMSGGQFPDVPADGTPVTGVAFDTDPFGNPRAIFGASGGAIDHTIQNQCKLRGGYAFTDWLELEGFLAQWSSDTDNENRTFLRDAAGNEVWQGHVIANGIAFDVPAAALAPSTRSERHLQWGTTLRTTRDTGWNGSAVFSEYAIREDYTLQADGDIGTNAERDGTGWQTFELQGVYTPVAGDWTGGAHTIALGYHRNDYRLESPIYTTDNWRQRAGSLVQDVHGDTRLQALYAQDVWAFTDRWAMTLGVRYEDWQASDGFQFLSGAKPEIYPARAQRTWSPKASLSFRPDDPWQLRLSAGRGVRFPTVAELFLGTVTAGQITRNDPNLKPEVSDALDFSVEYRPRFGSVRVSIFQDDIRDTIWNQVNVFVFPTRNTVQNVERVRTRGIESAFTIEDMGLDSLSLEGSVAYTRSRILRNDNHPDFVGNRWPRVPDWRAHLQAVWRPSAAWLASLGIRYSGRMFGQLANDDINGNTYGGISQMRTADGRVAYTTANGTELWKRFDGTVTKIESRLSNDGGRTFSAGPVLQTAGDSDQPRLVSAGRNILLVWRNSDGIAVRKLVAAIKPFGRETLTAIERQHAQTSFWLVLWDLECPYCMKSLANLAAAQRANPQLQVVTIATDPIAAADEIAARLAQLGIRSEAYAFAGAPREALQFAIDSAWLGEKSRAYHYGADGKRVAVSGVI